MQDRATQVSQNSTTARLLQALEESDEAQLISSMQAIVVKASSEEVSELSGVEQNIIDKFITEEAKRLIEMQGSTAKRNELILKTLEQKDLKFTVCESEFKEFLNSMHEIITAEHIQDDDKDRLIDIFDRNTRHTIDCLNTMSVENAHKKNQEAKDWETDITAELKSFGYGKDNPAYLKIANNAAELPLSQKITDFAIKKQQGISMAKQYPKGFEPVSPTSSEVSDFEGEDIENDPVNSPTVRC